MTAVPSSHLRTHIPPRILVAVLIMGIAALIAQVVLVRELLSLFLGNELAIAFVLAVWLAAVAAGSAIGARLAPRLRRPEVAFASSQVGLALILPATLLVVRSAHPPGITPGQAWGPGAMLLVALEALGPVCLLVGFQFVCAAAAAGLSRPPAEGVSPVAVVYALEAAGAMLGGIAFHFWLSQHVVAFGVFALTGILNTVSAFILLRPHTWPARAALALPCILLVAVLLRSSEADLAATQSNPRYAGYAVLSHTPSRYGDLTAALREKQLSIFQSGVLVSTSEDEYADEVTAHLTLLQHPAPRRVLLIGGAVGDLPRQILRHPVERLDCVDLDPKLFELTHRVDTMEPRHLSNETPNETKTRRYFLDARLFVQQSPPVYDVIIANIPDPTTAALNRFYTIEFFREARDALAPGGILAVTLTGSPHHLSGPLLLAAATTETTLRQMFPKVLLVPGETMFFLSTRESAALSADPQVLSRRLRVRGTDSDFVNDAWLRDALLPFRAEIIRQQIAQVHEPPLNTDLNPVSYHHQTRVWLDQLSPGLAAPMKTLSRVEVWWAAFPLLLAIAIVFATRGRATRLRSAAVLLAAAAIGAFGMTLDLLGLLAFQAARGYLYHAIGALVASFMAGLSGGAALVSLRRLDGHTSARLLAAALLASALIAALLPGILQAVLPLPALAGATVGLLLFLGGSLVGATFPTAVALYRQERLAAAAGGAVYAADLTGSAGAAVFAGAFAVPILGLVGTSQFAALLLAASLVLVLPLVRDSA